MNKKMTMKDITFIIPVHEYNEDLLTRALRSISGDKNTRVIIIGPSETIDNCEVLVKNYDLKVNLIKNQEETDFCSQINKAVLNCLTPYFSILEFDDIYTNIWLKHVEEHLNILKDVSIYLPITELVDENEKTLSLINELAWSSGFIDELGYIDNEALKSFYDFQISGGIIKTEDFISLGGLKPSLTMASVYEMLLRFTYNGKKVYVIPRIGYKHTCGRKNSYMTKWKDEITQEHGEWLIKTAQNEMFFKEDRKKAFNE